MEEISNKIDDKISNKILLWFVRTKLKKTKFSEFLRNFLHEKGTVDYAAMVTGRFYVRDGDGGGGDDDAMMQNCFQLRSWTDATFNIYPPFTQIEGIHQVSEDWIGDLYRRFFNVDPSHGLMPDWLVKFRGIKMSYTRPRAVMKEFLVPVRTRFCNHRDEIAKIYDVRHVYKHYATKAICCMKTIFLRERLFNRLPEPVFDHILIFLGLSENVYIK